MRWKPNNGLRMRRLGEGDWDEYVDRSVGNIQIAQFQEESFGHQCLECGACLSATCIWWWGVRHKPECTGKAKISDEYRQEQWDRTVECQRFFVDVYHKQTKQESPK